MWNYRKIIYIGGCTLVVVLAGCTSSQIQKSKHMDVLGPVLGVAGGAAGMYATKGQDIGTQMAVGAGGAAAGYLLGEFVKSGAEDEELEEFRRGYDLGRNNSAKELYWAIQNLNVARDGENKTKYELIPLPGPSQIDGVKMENNTILVPVVSQ